MKALELPLTILRPTAFMELMTHKKFFPPVAAWQVMPKLMGSSRRLPWLCTEDLGVIVARAFAAPHSFVGRDVTLASDVRSLDECRSIVSGGDGQEPAALPDARMAVRAFRVRGQGFDRDVAMAQNGRGRSGHFTDAGHPSGCADGRKLVKKAEGGSVIGIRVDGLREPRGLSWMLIELPYPLPGRSPDHALGWSLFTLVRGRGFHELRPKSILGR